jgi:hypothetical protein
MAPWLLLNGGTIHFSTHAKGVVKIVGYGNARCKQQAVVEFLVTETESVTNIDKREKKMTCQCC